MLNFIIIGGRLQREGERSGPLELEELVLQAFEQEGFTQRQARVKFYPWWSDWRDVARRLSFQRDRYFKEPFGIGVAAFSRGVGYGVTQLCTHLSDYGLKINCGVFCDGIYHHWYSVFGAQVRSFLGQRRSLWGGYQITFPPGSIDSWHGFYQDRSRPMGAEPLSTDAHRLSWTKLARIHTEMDDAPEWHEKCVEVALGLAQKYIPKKKAELKTDIQPMELLESKLANPRVDSIQVASPIAPSNAPPPDPPKSP